MTLPSFWVAFPPNWVMPIRPLLSPGRPKEIRNAHAPLAASLLLFPALPRYPSVSAFVPPAPSAPRTRGVVNMGLVSAKSKGREGGREGGREEEGRGG
jgi:hypothetical protein